MKYDDASWHYGGDFPSDSQQEFGGTHIGLFLRFCFIKGWAGELHTEAEPDGVAAVVQGTMPGTDFLFQYCDGKLTDEDFNDDGNAIAKQYYGDKGHYLNDYAANFGDLMYTAPESNLRTARSSETPVTLLRHFPGPIVRPSFDATQKSGRCASKCNAPGASTARGRRFVLCDNITDHPANRARQPAKPLNFRR